MGRGRARGCLCSARPPITAAFSAVLAHSTLRHSGTWAWGLARGAPACPDTGAYPWCDPGRPLDERVALLLAEVRPEELAPQVTNNIFHGVPPIERLGLKSFNFVTEGVHGLLLKSASPGPTSFPQAIAIAASFNTSLFQAIGEAIATEARFFWDEGFTQTWDGQRGYLQGLLLQNNVDIFSDPRWGRGQETPGEDPFLTSAYIAAWVKGLQALKGPRGVPLAGVSCKHFNAYTFEGGPTQYNRTSGTRSFVPGYSHLTRHNFNAHVSEQDMADTYLPAFHSCIAAGAKATMCAFNQLDGVPVCASKKYETELFRNTWGFQGVVLTDCGGIADMYSFHGWRPTPSETVRAALEAGVDVSCGNFLKEHATLDMEPLLRRGLQRALRMRFELGEFDPPVDPAVDTTPSNWMAPNLELALEAAQQSAVLLKNEGLTLPLAQHARVALLGPLREATTELLGSYAARPVAGGNITSPAAALAAANPGRVHLPPGGPEVCSAAYVPVGKPDADVAIIVGGLVGEDESAPDADMRPVKSSLCKGSCLEAEGCDRQHISWPLAQQRLLEEAVTWGIPVVLVIVSGGPLDLSAYKAPSSGIDSILWLGYPGQMGGVALANLIYGIVSPNGRLPQTFYRSDFADEVKITDMRLRPTSKALRGTGSFPGRTYRFVDEDRYVVYPFGYGLSYDNWQYAGPRCECTGFDCRLSFSVSAPQGRPSTSLSLLLFARPPPGGGAPRRELKRFVRVHGASVEHHVAFELGKADFELADDRGRFQVQPGTWGFELGEPTVLEVSFKITVSEASSSCLSKAVP